MARTCEDFYDCCDCGGNDCGCAYCWSCNACEECLSEDDLQCDLVTNEEKYR